jgi:glycosylphosphatidylinositol transamidase (GPIT) subunit GPI8
MYQTLRSHGYDDDHIVLIVEDNLADDARNVFPGKIFVERSNNPNITDPLVNDDVRENAVVDYHFSQLTRDDLADIMLGRQSDRLPQVIHPTATSDVFFFWSGHGGSGEGPLWGNEDARGFGISRIKDIVNEMAGTATTPEGLPSGARSYRRMMFCIETCFSGLWGEALAGQPNVLVLTAATANETSKADAHDRELGVFLSNAFARTFRRQVNANNRITIYDLYRKLFRTTTGSHVSIYNQQHYGSVYSETMSEFFPN